MHTRLMKAVSEVQGYLRELRARGRSVGLVPTMGALHEGHRSLIQRAKQQCDAVVVSVFVNPRQFNSPDDFARYPRELEQDVQTLTDSRVEAIFAPSAEDMYPAGFDTCVEPGSLASTFEGAARPGHFRGVATVVVKLFNLVQPDVAYFGQKDFQQVQMVHRLVEDLNLNVRLVICPTVREADGLALSSRNKLLTPEARQAATALHRSLLRGETLVHAGETDARRLLAAMREVLQKEPKVKLDYLALVNASQLQPVEIVTAGTVALVAASVDSVRLVDNLILGPPEASPDALLQLAFAARPVLDSAARIPGMQIDAVSRQIEACRDCAAIATVDIPPREFVAKYLKRDYPDLNRVRVLVIGRGAPINPDHYLYRHPEIRDRFTNGLYTLVGVEGFAAFRQEFLLTDALRCHPQSGRLPEKAISYCARHLREELKHFPLLETIITLGEDAYLQLQRHILQRRPSEIIPFNELLNTQGWAQEEVSSPHLGAGRLRAIYCHHPTVDYEESPSVAAALGGIK